MGPVLPFFHHGVVRILVEGFVPVDETHHLRIIEIRRNFLPERIFGDRFPVLRRAADAAVIHQDRIDAVFRAFFQKQRAVLTFLGVPQDHVDPGLRMVLHHPLDLCLGIDRAEPYCGRHPEGIIPGDRSFLRTAAFRRRRVRWGSRISTAGQQCRRQQQRANPDGKAPSSFHTKPTFLIVPPAGFRPIICCSPHKLRALLDKMAR